MKAMPTCPSEHLSMIQKEFFGNESIIPFKIISGKSGDGDPIN
jgi:hypothetical protein